MTVYRTTIVSLVTGLIMTSLAAVTLAHTAPKPPLDRQMAQLSALDREITSQIDHELSKHGALHGVRATVQRQRVTLSGTVPSLWEKQRAVKQVLEVEHVRSVLSRLVIASRESDAELEEEVVKRVRRYVYYTIFDNTAVRVDQGVVTLIGQVREGIVKRDLARIVSQVPGVKAIDNQIELLPAGGDRVRARVAARIYGHPQFQKYTFYRNPPIRIIVRRADVTLAGVVNSSLEKQLAQHLALHTFGVLTVTNELQVEAKTASH